MESPLILLSNDDGVHAHGIRELRQALARIGRVIVVAPEREQSACSHGITLHRPLRHVVVENDVHAIDGTPADCVYIALCHRSILPRRPDLVASGINHGPNLGNDVFYSGTVAAAREGALRGIPSIAFSTFQREHLEETAVIASTIAERLLSAPRVGSHPSLLNVNFPEQKPVGIRATYLGRRLYGEEVTERQDPRGRSYYWIGGRSAFHDNLEGSDTEAIEQGYVSVTPLSLGMTQTEHFDIATRLSELYTT